MKTLTGIILCSFLLLAGPSVFAQNTWTAVAGAALTDEGQSMIQAPDGGSLVAGNTSNYGAGGLDIWLTKFDALGNREWQATYGGTSNDTVHQVIAVSGGGYALAGSTQSFGAGQADFWILRLDAIGDIIWQYALGGSGYDEAYGIAETLDGGFAVTGVTASFGAGGWDAWVIRLDGDGAVQWQKTYGGSSDDGGHAILAVSDELIIGGYTLSFGAGMNDAWVFKVDDTGAMQWQKSLGGSDEDVCNALAPAAGGGVALGIQTQNYGSGVSDFWLIVLEGSGGVVWQKAYGGSAQENLTSLHQTSDGGYLLGGETLTWGMGGADAWTVKVDGTGTIQMQKAWGGGDLDRANSVTETADGGYAFAGYTSSYGAGSKDLWAIVMDANGLVGGPCQVGVDSTATGTPVSSSPADTSATVADTAATAAPTTAAYVTSASLITVCSGNTVFTATIGAAPSSGTAPLDVTFFADLAGGTPPYVYDWNFGDGSANSGESGPVHRYENAGTYTVTLDVTDSWFETASDAHVVKVFPTGISVDLSATPTSGTAPLDVTFEATASGGTPPYAYSWTFGDGGTSSDPTLVHTYTAEGTYPVHLNITDDEGDTASAYTEISVGSFWTWSAFFGGVKNDTAQDIVRMADGTFVTAGYCSTWGRGGQDWSVVKTTPAGSIIWEKTIGQGLEDRANALTVADDGGIVAFGYVFANVGARYDMALAKLSSSGTPLWATHFGSDTQADQFGQDIVKTDEGGFMLVGDNYGRTGNSDVWVIKTDANGVTQWQYVYGGQNHDTVQAITRTGDGDYIIAGSTRNFGNGDYDLWLLRIDGDGSIVWERAYGGSDFDESRDVIRTSDGGFLLVGWTKSYGLLGETLLVKVDENGLIQWQKILDTASQFGTNSAIQTSDGGYVLVGQTVVQEEYLDAFVLKMDGSGEILWQWAYGDYLNDEVLYNLRQVPDGGYVVAGNGGFEGGGLYDIMLMKIDAAGFIGGNCESPMVSTLTIRDVDLTVTTTSTTPEGSTFREDTLSDFDGESNMPTEHCVGNGPLIAFAEADPSTGPPPLDVQLQGSAFGGVQPYAYEWDFGDATPGSNTQNPPHSYSDTGLFTATLTVTDGEGTQAQDTVDISVSDCSISCSATVPEEAMAGLPVSFQGFSGLDGCLGDASYSWTFGDGTGAGTQNPNHTYDAAGTYDWTLTVTADWATCSVDGTIEILVCEVSCSSSVPSDGVRGRPVTFESDATISDVCSGAIRFDWDFGDGTTAIESDLTHVYTAVGSYDWTLTVTVDGQTCIQEGTIEIWDPLVLDGDLGIGSINCTPDLGNSPLFVSLWANLVGGKTFDDVPHYHCTWDFGDGTSASDYQGYLKTYTNPGVYLITVTCVDAIGQTVTGTYTLNVGQGPPCGIGDYGRAADREPLPPMPLGARQDPLFAPKPEEGPDYECLYVDLVADPDVGSNPLDVLYTANITGGQSPYQYWWTFGYPDEPWFHWDTGPTQGATYEDTGTYTATVIVVDSYYHPYYAKATVNVNDPFRLVIAATNTTGETPVDVIFDATATGGVPPYLYRWDFDDGETSGEEDPVHRYTVGRTYEVICTAWDSLGQQLVSDPLLLEFDQGFAPEVSASPTAGSVPLIVVFDSTVYGGAPPYSYAWDFDYDPCDAGEEPPDCQLNEPSLDSDDADPVHQYTETGTYQARLYVTDHNGDVAMGTPITIRVNDVLRAVAFADPALGGIPLAVEFSATVTGGMEPYSYTWDFGDGGISSDPAPTHTYTQEGTYTVNLTVTDGASVIASSPALTIYAVGPLAILTSASPEEGDEPLRVDFSTSASGGMPPYTYSWDFGDDTPFNTYASPSHIYERRGEYTAQVTVTDLTGTSIVATHDIVVNADEPDLLWRLTLGGNLIHEPVVGTDGSIYVTDERGMLYGISGDGALRWETEVGGLVTGSLAYYKDLIYFPLSTHQMAAFSKEGAKVWTMDLEEMGTAVAVDACTGDLYFGSYDGSAYCATFDGALKWHREMPGSITIPPVVGQNGKVYFYSNSYEHEVDDITYIFPSTLRALNPGGGGDYWTHYVYYSDTLYGLEASTPMVMDSDDNLYLTDSSGYLFSVEPGYDSYRWNTTLGSSAPIIAGGTVLVPELGTLRALGTSGTGLWSFGYGIGDTPAISADGKIYIWGGEGIGLYVLDLITGEQLHSLETHGNGRDMVLYSHHLKGRLLFIDGADTLSCYEVSSGPASGSWAQYGGTYKHLNRREDAPWVSIDSPDEGAVLSGEESVLINGSDDMTCIPMKAHVYVDDALVDTTNSLPYAYQWHTGASQDGNYTLTVLGVDKAGNESRTHVNVTVDNPAAPTYGPADPIPTFSWNAPDGEKKYRIYFATDSDFNNIITRKKRWTKKTSWTPSKKKWKKVLAVAAGSTPRIVYWKVIGKKTGLVHMGMFYVTN